MPTIYSILKESGIKFTPKDLKNIGINVFASAKERGIEISEIEQVEGKDTFIVKSYPNEFATVIQKLVIRYFKNKANKKNKT